MRNFGSISGLRCMVQCAALLLVVAAVAGCPRRPVVTVTVSPTTAEIEAGADVVLTAASTDAADTFTWTSESEATATVVADAGGTTATVTGVAAGVVSITATGTSSGVSASAVITVTETVVEVDLAAKLVDASFADPTDPDDAGWGSRDEKDGHLIVETSSGSPLLGGHGGTGAVGKAIQIQAAYDAANVYLRLLWPDTEADDTNRAWVYDGEGWSRGGEEDRIYVAWPIIDGPGREGKTFAEAGCAMFCHQSAFENANTLVVDTVTPINDCSLCHVNVAGAHVDDTPPFQHLAVGNMDCSLCHGSLEPEVVTDGVTFNSGDMIAPAGTAFDIWHWKAQRSNPLGVAEDQFTADGMRRSRDGSNLAPDNVTQDASGGNIPRYIWVDAAAHASGEAFHLFRSMVDGASADIAEWNADTQQYENLADGTPVVPAAGDTANRHILRDDLIATDDSANVGANGVYDAASQTWAVVLWRSFVSADTVSDTDVEFDVEGVIPFSLAVTDNSGIVHHGVAGPIRMGFAQ